MSGVNIQILKALHGDAFVLHCKKGEAEGVVVVDGGPHADSQNVISVFDSIGVIDLMVLTHYDLDHIGGIIDFVERHKNDKPFPVKEIWCNCAYEVPVTPSADVSYTHAKKLADLLREINEGLAADGYEEVDWKETLIAGQVRRKPYADFNILSPESVVKTANDEKYQDEVANISASHKRQKIALSTSLEDLSKNKKEEPSTNDKSELINWSSIAFYLNCDNFSILMLGDSFPGSVIKGLKQFGYSESNRLPVDYVKVSHHGSKNNISNTLLNMVDCHQYIISTNGGQGIVCHPDRETIGNILYHPKRDLDKKVKVYFNYPKSLIEANGYPFLNEGEDAQANFEVQYDTENLQ